MNKLKIEKYRKKPLGFDNELCVEKIYTNTKLNCLNSNCLTKLNSLK